RPSEPTIDIEQAARLSVMSLDPAVASRREPECRHAGYAPLASVAMPAEDQIDGVVVLQLIEDVWGMGQQEGEAILCVRWQTAQVDGPPAGQGAVHIGEPGNLVCGQSEFPMGNETKEPVEWFAQTMSDEGTGSIGPGPCASRHPITRSSSMRSEGVTR